MAAKKQTQSSNARSAPAAPWGVIPTDATRWTACFLVGNQREKLSHESEEEGVVEYEFDIADLSVDTLRERWGSGKYQLQWMADAAGKRIACGNARPFTLTPKPEDANFSERSQPDDEDEDDEDDEDDDEDDVQPQPQDFMNPMTSALQMLAVINDLADRAGEKHMRMHKETMEQSLSMARLLMDKDDKVFERARIEKEDATGVAAMRHAILEIGKQVEAQGSALNQILSNPPQAQAQAGGSSGPGFSVGEGAGIGQIAGAAVAAEVVKNLPDIMGAGVGLVNNWVQGRKEKLEAQEKARSENERLRAVEEARRAMQAQQHVPVHPVETVLPTQPVPVPVANTGLPKGDGPPSWAAPIEVREATQEEKAS